MHVFRVARVCLVIDEYYIGDTNKHYIEHLTKQNSLKSQPTRINKHKRTKAWQHLCSQSMDGTMEDSEAASL
jgi:hypothetical protein